MRVFITSTPEELAPLRRIVAEAVRERDFVPMARDPDVLAGFRPVDACARQVGRADAVLAIVGDRRGEVPAASDGGDGHHPWAWWETRAAFRRRLPVTALLSENDSDDAIVRDLRGELTRLAAFFDPADPDAFRDLVRRQLDAIFPAEDDVGAAASSRQRPELRRWPPPSLPPRPYPVLLPYTHPELLAGRDREIDTLRRRLERPVAITGLHAVSGTGKSSLLAGGLVPLLRAEGRPVAFERHPCEPGIAARLLGELVEGGTISDIDAAAFIDALDAVRRTAETPPVLALDQFEDLFRDLPGAADARRVIATLLAASAQRLPGSSEAPCRWLLAYRQEFHGDVVRWLRNVNPIDLSTPERFQTFVLPPLGTPAPGTDDPTSASARAFEAAVTKPLRLKNDDGTPRYAWIFEGDSAARLARAFGEARTARPDAPLAPELQVVLAHLLENARPRSPDAAAVHVPDDPAAMIDQALEEHLRRSLDVAFPGGERETRLGRTRALLALRELADARGRRGSGRSAAELAYAIGPEGDDVLEKLATARTRIVLLEEHDGEQIYVLSHDRMAEVLVRLFDEGTFSGLGVDAELLGLRRAVALHSELFASGEVEEGTRLSRKDARRIEQHADALLWGEERRRWWTACRERLRRDRRRGAIRWGTATVVALAVGLGAWMLAERRTAYQGWIGEVATARDREAALSALVRLTSLSDSGIPAAVLGFDEEDLRAALKRREETFDVPMDVLEQGMGALEGKERSRAVLRMVELVLPWVRERPEDPELIANLVWPLDYGPARDSEYAVRARELRDRVFEPLRRLRPPPEIADDDPDWIEIPAGTFLRGVDGAGGDGERTRIEVAVSGFRMLRHEVTNAEYRRLVPGHPASALGEMGSEERPFYEQYFTDDNLPAAFISWYQAYTYAAWIGGRLPTEAEWEYAARAGCPHEHCDREGQETTVQHVAWTRESSMKIDVAWSQTPRPIPAPVMSLEPNPWGIYDALGNLTEWTADWLGRYPVDQQHDPAGPTAIHGWFGGRAIRGGSYDLGADRARLASRNRAGPVTERESLGWRVVLPRTLYPELGSTTRQP